ncbi:MAG TPA: lytic transglycosylase domain-containing protein [Stellaceae bacterium]|nr:lytic transglycosylase domain-containing protein [Stellaceae bacterium]
MLAQAIVACIVTAASAQHLPPAIVASILAVEGGQEGSRVPDADGSADLGPGQINTIWIGEVAKASGQTAARAELKLQWDGCFNIRVSAAILRHEINAAGGDFWTGVGHYHSHDPAESLAYQKKVVAAAARLFGPKIFAPR